MDDLHPEKASAAALNLPDQIAATKAAVVERTAAAIVAMGTGYVLHPGYRDNPRHSLNPDIYAPARARFLADIAAAAEADRKRNPMWQLANRVRAALGPASSEQRLRRVG